MRPARSFAGAPHRVPRRAGLLELAQEREPGLGRRPAEERAGCDGQPRAAHCARDPRSGWGRAGSRPRAVRGRADASRSKSHPGISVVREEATSIPDGRVIVATGPLTSPGLEQALGELVGSDRLAFYDAAAPIVEAESLDRAVVFAQSRYDKGETRRLPQRADDTASSTTRSTTHWSRPGASRPRSSSRTDLFQACQPVEEVARTGRDSLRFGALKPVGLTDPASGERPWAVVQLRAENRAGSAYNLVGFQTNLAFPEQERVFRMIPGLADAVFLRHGVMHRNTFVDAPRVLDRSPGRHRRAAGPPGGPGHGNRGLLGGGGIGPARRAQHLRRHRRR